MRRPTLFSTASALLLLGAGSAAAQMQHADGVRPMQENYLADIDTMHSKFVQLAEAMSAEQYAWRPMEGVRSVSEVFMLIAAENYLVPSGWEADLPEGMTATPAMFKTLSEVADKREVVDHLRKSFVYYRAAVAGIPEGEMHVKRNFFGREVDTSQVLFLITVDQHEHLGQAIAYARMNRVVPPWSR